MAILSCNMYVPQLHEYPSSGLRHAFMGNPYPLTGLLSWKKKTPPDVLSPMWSTCRGRRLRLWRATNTTLWNFFASWAVCTQGQRSLTRSGADGGSSRLFALGRTTLLSSARTQGAKRTSLRDPCVPEIFVLPQGVSGPLAKNHCTSKYPLPSRVVFFTLLWF